MAITDTNIAGMFDKQIVLLLKINVRGLLKVHSVACPRTLLLCGVSTYVENFRMLFAKAGPKKGA